MEVKITSARHNTHASQLQKAFTTTELVALRFEFNRFDADNSNTIDKEELRQVVKNLSGGVELSDQQLKDLMAEVDDDESGEIDWEEYLELIINLRTGRGLREGAVSGLLSRPPLVLVVEAELGHRSFVVRLLKEVRLNPQLVPQGKLDIVDFKSAAEALDFMRELPPSRKCCFCICDNHGILANKFCQDLEAECLVPPPVVYFAIRKSKGDPAPHLVQQHILKENFDAGVAQSLIETFCVAEVPRDDDEGPTTASGHLRKNGMIGGRGKQGHRGHGKKGIAKTHMVRAPKSFDRARWTGALGSLSPRALSQLAVVGGATEGTSKVYHINPVELVKIEAEKQHEIDVEEEKQRQKREGEEAIRLAEEEERLRLPVWKLLVSDGYVRTCSGLHFIETSEIEGEIETPRPPPKSPRSSGWSPRYSPRHNKLMNTSSLHNSPSSSR